MVDFSKYSGDAGWWCRFTCKVFGHEWVQCSSGNSIIGYKDWRSCPICYLEEKVVPDSLTTSLRKSLALREEAERQRTLVRNIMAQVVYHAERLVKDRKVGNNVKFYPNLMRLETSLEELHKLERELKNE